MITARLLEDCAHNLRILYQLPVPVSEELLSAAGANDLTVNRFSQYVAGASDHVAATFAFDPPVRAEGVAGSTDLVVTFGSLTGAASPDSVGRFERCLERSLASIDR